MTGYETYLVNNGFKRIVGNGLYNTYTNNCNSYKKDDKTISFIIAANPTMMIIDEPILCFVPQDDFEEFTNNLLKGKLHHKIKKDNNIIEYTFMSKEYFEYINIKTLKN